MARTRRIKIESEGTAYYHLMSRTNDKRFLFSKGAVKTELVLALKRAAEFSGIELEAYAAMDNHFHVICKVVRGGEPVSGSELIRRVGVLKGRKAAEELAEHWDDLEKAGFDATLKTEQDRLRARMNDISAMMKTFKELFNLWYKREKGYCGSIWAGRFTSTLVEKGRYLAVCRRYVMLNPVRARIVTQAKDYKWSWSREEGEEMRVNMGSVPEEKLMKRVAQIGGGKILGSEEFVRKWVFGLGHLVSSKSAGAHKVGEIGYSSHGWKLEKKAA